MLKWFTQVNENVLLIHNTILLNYINVEYIIETEKNVESTNIPNVVLHQEKKHF